MCEGDMFFDNSVETYIFFCIRIDAAHNETNVFSDARYLICELVRLSHSLKLLHHFRIWLSASGALATIETISFWAPMNLSICASVRAICLTFCRATLLPVQKHFVLPLLLITLSAYNYERREEFNRGQKDASIREETMSSSSDEKRNYLKLTNPTAIVAFCVLATIGGSLPANAQYVQHNLLSDQAGQADLVDPNLVNAWGLSRSATSPWWISDNGTGHSTL
jgi:hypothetical protein